MVTKYKWMFARFWWRTVLIIILVLQLSGSTLAQEKTPANILEVTAAIPCKFPPQYDLDENGKPVGFAIDIMNQIAALAGLKMIYHVEDTWSATADALRSGQADLIPNLGITPERQVEFAFTATIETFPISIFVREQTSDITGLADLTERKVGAVEYNIAVSLLREQSGVQLKVFDHPTDALFELLAGNVDALVYPKPVLLKMAQDISVGERIKVVGKPLIEIKRAVAVRKNDTGLLQRLDRAVNSFVRTTDYQNIYVKWYGEPKPFWTASRVALVMGMIFLPGLAAIIAWRYQTMIKLNRQLLETTEERKQLENALWESREVLRAVFDATHDSVMLLNSEGTILAINTIAAQRFSKTPKELFGLELYSLLTPKLTASKKKKLQGAALTKEPVRFTDERAGRVYDNTIYPILDSEGNASRFAIFARDITEHRQAEDALQKTTSILHAIFEGAIDALYAKDLKGYYLRINSAGAQLFGKSTEQIIGKDDRALFLSRSARRTTELDRKVITTGESLTLEETLTTVSGVTRIYLTTKSPYRNEHGEVIGLVGISRDITERKHAEEALRKSEIRLKRTQQIAHIGYWKRNFQTGEAEWSDEQYRLFGYERGQVQPTFELLRSHIHPDDVQEVTGAIMDALNYGKSIDVEFRFFRKNGEVRFAHSQGEAESDETGTWIHGTLHDITARKQTEKALRKSEEQYRLIIDNAFEGIFVAQEGILCFLNCGVEEIWGYSREEMLSLSFLDFIHPDDRDIVTATHFNRLRSGDGLNRTSFRIITKDGSIKWVETSDVLIVWEGKPATLNFATDITERKLAEEALRDEKDFAESLVETAQAIVLVLDTEGRIIRFNPYMEEVSGYSLEEVQGEDWFATFLPKCDQDRIRTLFLQAIDDIQTRGNVNPIVTKDGCERVIEWYDKTLKDAEGNTVGLLSIGQDITERKQVKE